MAAEWRTVSLSELYEFSSGLSKPRSAFGSGYPFLSFKDVFYRFFVPDELPELVDSTDEERARCSIRRGDVFLTRTSETIDELGMSCVSLRDISDATFNGFTKRLRPKASGEVVPEYAGYYFRSPKFRRTITAMSSMSTRASLNNEMLARLSMDLPPLREQAAIGRILGALDNKIELNRRMSKTLEEMARALFKSWFVDFDPVRAKAESRDPGLPKPLADLFPDRFADSELGEIPEGWDVGTLSQYFQVGLGGAWGKDEEDARATVAIRCLRGIDCHDLAEGRIPDVPLRWVSAKQAANRSPSDGTILIEGSGSFCGRSMIWTRAYERIIGRPVGYSNFCKRLDPICSADQAVVCWMQMRQSYREGLLQSFRTGTAFPNFDVHGALATVTVVVPPEPVAAAFATVFHLHERLDLMAQSRCLASLREALLPKLISGELRTRTPSGRATARTQ